MAIPWFVVFKALPWGVILDKASEIAGAANARRSQRQTPFASVNQLQDVTDRLAILEQERQADIELISRVTTQVDALSTAVAVLGSRVRWLLALSAVSSLISVIAIWLAMTSR